MKTKRPGYYVDKKEWFRDHFHQARGRAAFLAEEHGRPITVTFVAHDSGDHLEVCTIYNGKRQVA